MIRRLMPIIAKLNTNSDHNYIIKFTNFTSGFNPSPNSNHNGQVWGL